MLISLLLAFSWIAGIIWLVFFRKKMDEDPNKQKIYTIVVSILSGISFLFFLNSVVFAPPSPTNLKLIAQVEGQELDVNSDYNIAINYAPEDASLSSVIYDIDDDILAEITVDETNDSLLILHTKNEGTINITAKCGETESNTLTFEIVDIEARRLAEEKAAEEARLAEEAEKQRLAEEKAAEEERKKAESSKTQSQSTQQTQSSSNKIVYVWIDDTAAKYHKTNGCGMDNAYQVTIEEAESKGKTPCGRCY